MKPYNTAFWSAFVDAGIPVTVILLTLGELGIPKDERGITPQTMRDVRFGEFDRATNALGVSREIMPFADLYMSEGAIGPLIPPVLSVVREKKFGVIFSFHPQEITPEFDHPDHQTAGMIARTVGAASDVLHYHPECGEMEHRPSLYLWTTDGTKATHSITLSDETRRNRNTYLSGYYPSQFPLGTQPEWERVFDRITGDGNGGHRELYLKVR